MTPWILRTTLACSLVAVPLAGYAQEGVSAPIPPPGLTAQASGSRLLFESEPNSDGQSFIFAMTLGSPIPQQIGADPAHHPSISRTGDLFYSRYIERLWGRITKTYHYQLPDGPELWVTKNELGDETEPCISRDGQVLAFTSLREANIELIAYKRPFVDQKEFTRSAIVESDPCVDATGSKVYCTLTFSDHTEIWRWDWSTGKSERVAGVEEGIYTQAADPSVDGQNRWMAFTSTRDGNPELYIRDLTSGVETRLTESEGFDGEAALSEDGKRLAFVSDRDGDREIFLMDLATQQVTQLTHNDHPEYRPYLQ